MRLNLSWFLCTFLIMFVGLLIDFVTSQEINFDWHFLSTHESLLRFILYQNILQIGSCSGGERMVLKESAARLPPIQVYKVYHLYRSSTILYTLCMLHSIQVFNRDTKSKNFPVGRLSRAKTFRTECIKFLVSVVTFQTVWKLYSLSGHFSDYLQKF